MADFTQNYTLAVTLPSAAESGYRVYTLNGDFRYVRSTGTTAQRPAGAPVGHPYWDTTTNGLVVWNGASWAAVTTGTVTSVFGRTGAVVAQTNDYRTDQIQNFSIVPGATLEAALTSLQEIQSLAAGSGALGQLLTPNGAGGVKWQRAGGTTAQRPADPGVGWTYWDTSIDEEIVWLGTRWVTTRYKEPV